MTTQKHWCTIWGNAMSITEHKVETYSKDLTLRYPITIPFPGNQIKITFDNFCGTEPIKIAETYIAFTGENDKSILTETLLAVTFDGKLSCEIPAGERLESDPISTQVKQNDRISISFYLDDYTQMRSSVIATGPLSKGFYSVGNRTKSEVLPMDLTRNTNCFYFLSDIKLYTEKENHAVICYGDSITAQDWPDYLALQYMAAEDNHTAIVRKAASGTRILRQYSCITYESYGLKADVRFPHELPVEGADTIIIQQGINDIIHPVGEEVNPFRPMSDLPTVDEITDGLTYYIDEAKKYGYKTYLGTLLPIEGWRTYAVFRELMKNGVNDWIRFLDTVDGCIDFDEAVRNPQNSSSFAEGFDSGDHLHPSAAAYKAMAEKAYAVLHS